MPAAATTEGGMATNAAPDVCYLPAPMPPAGPGGIPTPYPNLGKLSGADETTTRVFVRNKKALVEGSFLPSSRGDEAGCSSNPVPGPKGVASQGNLKKIEFSKHSGKVKLEGRGAIFQGVPTKHNDSNTAGSHGVASQSKVIVAP